MIEFTKRLEAAREILGEQTNQSPRMSHCDYDAEIDETAFAVALVAEDEKEAHELAGELAEVICNRFPAWRGWGIEYGDEKS